MLRSDHKYKYKYKYLPARFKYRISGVLRSDHGAENSSGKRLDMPSVFLQLLIAVSVKCFHRLSETVKHKRACDFDCEELHYEFFWKTGLTDLTANYLIKLTFFCKQTWQAMFEYHLQSL